jgi:carboxyl-terminal processing protease
MRVSTNTIREISLSLLLIILGSLAQYRFNVVQKIAGLSPIPILQNSRGMGQKSNIVNQKAPTGSSQSDVDFSTFWEVWDYLERDYLEPEKIVSENMVNGAIQGMAASLGDPYTAYLSPDDNERSGQDLAGAFYGVGIELGYIDGILAVIAPIEDSPAGRADVQAGDLIFHVKDEQKNIDEDSAKWSLDKAVETIRGPKDTTVVLSLVREGLDEPLEVPLVRGEIVVKSAELEFVEHNGKKVAHIKLSRFGERTNGEWDNLVSEIIRNKSSIAGIVLDMRNNPGGFFDGAIDVSSEFISNGVVVTQKGQFSQQDFKAKGNARLKDIPIEVLVNRGSASASEIVAGALRDQLGAQLVGETTFGKGTVQDRRELSNGGGLHVTIARWLLPKGDWIHDEGIPVDVEIKDDPETEADEQLQKAIEVI